MIDEKMVHWTVSNLFLVPLLKITRNRLHSLGFVNSYLFNSEENIVYENVIHMLFKPVDVKDFNQFVDIENKRHSDIVDEHDYIGGFILLTYKLPDAFKKDYDLIWQGRYSDLSKDFRNAIPSTVKFINNKGTSSTNMSVQHMIMDRYQPLRKYWEEKLAVSMDDAQELWTRPTIESETFKLKNHEPITASP